MIGNKMNMWYPKETLVPGTGFNKLVKLNI